MDKFVNKAIEQAAQILGKIDEKWPAEMSARMQGEDASKACKHWLFSLCCVFVRDVAE